MTRKSVVERYRKSEKGRAVGRSAERNYRQTLSGRAGFLYRHAKARAKRNEKIPFTITKDWVVERLKSCNGRCEITKTPLSFDIRGNCKRNPFAPSLDQIIAGKGYTPTNVQIVAVWYNQMKMDMTDSEAIQIILECQDGLLNR